MEVPRKNSECYEEVDLRSCSYRQLQTLAMSLKIPANIKRPVLCALIDLVLKEKKEVADELLKNYLEDRKKARDCRKELIDSVLSDQKRKYTKRKAIVNEQQDRIVRVMLDDETKNLQENCFDPNFNKRENFQLPNVSWREPHVYPSHPGYINNQMKLLKPGFDQPLACSTPVTVTEGDSQTSDHLVPSPSIALQDFRSESLPTSAARPPLMLNQHMMQRPTVIQRNNPNFYGTSSSSNYRQMLLPHQPINYRSTQFPQQLWSMPELRRFPQVPTLQPNSVIRAPLPPLQKIQRLVQQHLNRNDPREYPQNGQMNYVSNGEINGNQDNNGFNFNASHPIPTTSTAVAPVNNNLYKYLMKDVHELQVDQRNSLQTNYNCEEFQMRSTSNNAAACNVFYENHNLIGTQMNNKKNTNVFQPINLAENISQPAPGVSDVTGAARSANLYAMNGNPSCAVSSTSDCNEFSLNSFPTATLPPITKFKQPGLLTESLVNNGGVQVETGPSGDIEFNPDFDLDLLNDSNTNIVENTVHNNIENNNNLPIFCDNSLPNEAFNSQQVADLSFDGNNVSGNDVQKQLQPVIDSNDNNNNICYSTYQREDNVNILTGISGAYQKIQTSVSSNIISSETCCRYENYGCAFVVKEATTLMRHEQNCIYQQTCCPVGNCDWHSNLNALHDHISQIHADEIHTSASTSFSLSLSEVRNSSQIQLFQQVENINFIITLNRVENRVYVSIQSLQYDCGDSLVVGSLKIFDRNFVPYTWEGPIYPYYASQSMTLRSMGNSLLFDLQNAPDVSFMLYVYIKVM